MVRPASNMKLIIVLMTDWESQYSEWNRYASEYLKNQDNLMKLGVW